MKIFSWLKKYKLNVATILVLLIFGAILEVNIPTFLSNMVDIGISGKGVDELAHGYFYDISPFNTQLTYVIISGLKMLGLVLLAIICTISYTYIISKTVTSISNDMRKKVFSKVMDFRKSDISKFKVSSLITRTSQDINQVQNFFVVFFRLALYAPILGIGSILKVIEISPPMSMVIFAGIVIAIFVLVIAISIVTPKMKKRQGLLDKQNSVFASILRGNLDIRSMNSQPLEKARYEAVNEDIKSTQAFIDYAFYFMFPTLFLVIEVMMVAIIFFGAIFIDRGDMTIGNLLAFSQYASQVVVSFRMLMFFIVFVPRVSVSSNRIDEVLNHKTKIIKKLEIAKTKDLEPTDESVILEFRDVSFKFEDADSYSVKNLSFKLNRGENLGIIGTIGSGKSTLLDLILRIIEPTEGSIFLMGRDVRTYSREELYSIISFSPQDMVLFSGSVLSNIIYGNKNATQDRIDRVLDISMMKDFITDELGGVNRKVSQGAKNFSGGQKQRMSIARALMKESQIYAFDDSFSALDANTDRILRKKLSEFMKKQSLIVVSSRVNTISDFEKILVLDDGVLIGYDKHDKLIESCDIYKQLVQSQKNRITDVGV